MKKILSKTESGHLNKLLAETEKRLDVQIVLAIIKRSDSYAEIPWKAFALGTSVAGLIIFFLSLILPVWGTPFLVLISVGSTMLCGMLLALSAVLIPGFARLFLSVQRAETEVQQYAESVFLSHEIFSTRDRTGLLLLVSLFERQVFLLPDKGIRDKLGNKEFGQVIEPMKPYLAARDLKRAFEVGLGQIGKLLEPYAGSEQADRSNELSNQIIEEEGI